VVFGVIVGTGIGGGICINGQVLAGARSPASGGVQGAARLWQKGDPAGLPE
jgi:hypothetical protein